MTRKGEAQGYLGGFGVILTCNPDTQAAEQRVSFGLHESCAAQGWGHSPRGGKTVPGGESARDEVAGRRSLSPTTKAASLMPRCPQVWEKNRKLKSFNLSALEKHGPVYEDGEAPGW